MEDNRNDRNGNERNDRNDYRNDHRNNHNHNRNRNRFRHGNPQGGHHGKGRVQRPLLTSAINGAGLVLVALVLVKKTPELSIWSSTLGLSAAAFGLSSLVSYIAQRLRPRIVELVSDLLFLVGAGLVVYVALKLGEFI